MTNKPTFFDSELPDEVRKFLVGYFDGEPQRIELYTVGDFHAEATADPDSYHQAEIDGAAATDAYLMANGVNAGDEVLIQQY